MNGDYHEPNPLTGGDAAAPYLLRPAGPPPPCPHCGSSDVDRGASGLDLCDNCGGLSRDGRTIHMERGGDGWQHAIVGDRTDEDLAPPCPDDPDGLHHIGCGCPDSDYLE